jgi:hypothetical protein
MDIMEYVVITLTPQILNLNPVVHGPFETLDEAEEFLNHWISSHPGTRGIVRRLIRPVEMPGDELYEERGREWYNLVRRESGSTKQQLAISRVA